MKNNQEVSSDKVAALEANHDNSVIIIPSSVCETIRYSNIMDALGKPIVSSDHGHVTYELPSDWVNIVQRIGSSEVEGFMVESSFEELFGLVLKILASSGDCTICAEKKCLYFPGNGFMCVVREEEKNQGN